MDYSLIGKNAWICSNDSTVYHYNNDNMCGFRFTNNGFCNLFKLQKGAFTKKGWQVKNPELPILVIAGEDDPVIKSKEKFYKLIAFLNGHGYNNIQSKLYENKRHELLNETDNKMIYSDIVSFFIHKKENESNENNGRRSI